MFFIGDEVVGCCGTHLEIKMKDFLGKELEVGDRVVFMQINYRNLLVGCVEKITPKKVRLQFQERGRPKTCLQDPEQVVKILS